MSPRTLAYLILTGLLCGSVMGSACAQDYPKLAPYSAIRWKDNAPEVRLDGKWYGLESINDLSVTRIIEYAKPKYDTRWQKRFDEDLVQVLSEMGHAPGKAVKLVVRDADGKVKTLDNVALTEENRRDLMEFKYPRAARPVPPSALKSEALSRALDEFKAVLDERWSYRHANGADFDAAIAALRKKIDAGLSPGDFGIELQKIIALGIDGHASVSGYDSPPGGYLPFLVEPDGERYVAFKVDRTGFLAEGFPYLMKIDGRAVADWCAAAAVLVPKGSPQYVRRNSLRHLRDLDYLRGLMNLPKRDTVELELFAADGKTRKTVTHAVNKRPAAYGEWPRGGSRLLEGNVGYLRLPIMDRNAVKQIKEWLPKFRDTAGLVVDVRDNGGGSREALVLLYSYLSAPEDAPRVFTAAAYRLHKEHKDDHLVSRFMYRADAKEWTSKEREVVAQFAKTFKPEWQLPKGQFSDWHYMALSRVIDPDVYHYQKPVVVLMNEKCFSATDIFLAGLKGMKNVTLIGTPSGGGSALGQTITLGGTPFRIRIGSMASFQADGKLFDRNGVRPDVVVEPAPEYHIGGPDIVLAEAVKRVSSK